MAETIGEAVVHIRPNTDGFGEGLRSKLGGVAAAVGGVLAAKEIIDFGRDSVAAFREAETQTLKLEDAYSKFPALAGGSAKAIQDLSAALATKTRFDDDATNAAAAQLAQFGLTQKQLQTMLPLVQDFAARTGQDLTSAADQVGKAMLGQGRALKQVGIDFQDTGNAAGNFDQIVSGLRTQVGGFAEKEGQSASGQAAIMSNAFGEVKEAIGGALQPAISALLPTFSTLIQSLAPILTRVAQSAADLFVPLIPAISQVLTALSPLLPIFAQIATMIGGVLAKVLIAIAPVIAQLATMFAEILGEALEVIVQLMPDLVGLLITLFQAFAPLLPIILQLAGVLLGSLLTAIAPLIPIIVKLIERFIGTKDQAGPLMRIIEAVAKVLVLLSPVIELVAKLLGGILGKALELVTPLLNGLFRVFEKIAGAVEKVMGWIGRLIEKLGKVKLPSFLTPGSPSPWELSLRRTIDLIRNLVRITPGTLGFALAGGASLSVPGVSGGGVVVSSGAVQVSVSVENASDPQAVATVVERSVQDAFTDLVAEMRAR